MERKSQMRNLRNMVQPRKLRKLSKIVVLCVSAFLILNTLSTFSFTASLIATSSALHTSGGQILNANNDVVYLRGVGIGGFAPDNIFWGLGGSDNWGDQWQTGSSLTTCLDQTFEELSTVWNVNMISVFFYPEWWWEDNVTPSVESGYTNYGTAPISTRAYLQTLCATAESYGIYVDICPYQLTACSTAYASDTYLTPNQGGAQGIPMNGDWDSAASAFLASTGYSTEGAFWTAFWTDISNSLKAYPNAIFEAWNEPGDSSEGGTGQNVVDSGYLSYLTIMYDAVRSTGSTNLIFMQWQPGWMPNGWGFNLSWASQITAALGGSPTNLVFTTHIYYYSPADLTPYWNQNGVDSSSGGIPMTTAQIQSALHGLQQSMGVNAPLVFNEAGDCQAESSNLNNDNAWWNSVCVASNQLGIGVCAFFWLRPSTDGGLGWYGEGLIGTAPNSPNTMGQEFINAYTGTSASSPTTTPTPIATGTLSPTPTATPALTSTPVPTPTPKISANSGIGIFTDTKIVITFALLVVGVICVGLRKVVFVKRPVSDAICEIARRYLMSPNKSLLTQRMHRSLTSC